MNRPLKNFIYTLVYLALATGLHAERFAKIMYYQAPKDAPEDAFIYQTMQKAKEFKESKNNQEVSLRRHKFSKTFELDKGALKLTFLPKELPADVEVPADSPSVNIPADWSKVILLVSQDQKNKVMPMKVLALNASDEVFAPGCIMFVNNTDIVVGGLVAGEELILKAKSYKVIKVPLAERGEFSLLLDSYNPKTVARRNLIRKRWLHIPEFRNVVFVTKLPPPRMAKCFVAEIRKF